MTPDFRLQIDGTDITSLAAPRLESLTLTDARGFQVDTLDIALSDHDGKLAIPRRGAKVRLYVGWTDSPLEDKGEYLVDEVEHAGAPDHLTIRARSADLRSSLTKRLECSFDAITLADIGNTAYIVDDSTVAKTDNSAARKAAGKIIDVDAAGVWVLVG